MEFRPAWWLPGPHLQTIWARMARPRSRLRYRRDVLLTPDGDDLVIDHLDGPPGGPLVVLLHGLEGSSHSVYAQGIAGLIREHGGSAAVMNFRGCARDPRHLGRPLPNRGRRLYHSGETSDLEFLLRTLAGREPDRPLAAIGVSLGGNVLLKWLGESTTRAPGGGEYATSPPPARVAAAATLSVPYDLAAGARGLERGLSRHYVGIFLRSLRIKVEGLLARHPDLADRVDRRRLRQAQTFWAFDDAATAPIHGFAGAADYYARSSSLGYLGRIATPTLCLSAEDDPFLPAEALHRARAAAAPAIRFIMTRSGGHVGFVAGPRPGRSQYQGEEFVVTQLLEQLKQGRG